MNIAMICCFAILRKSAVFSCFLLGDIKVFLTFSLLALYTDFYVHVPYISFYLVNIIQIS